MKSLTSLSRLLTLSYNTKVQHLDDVRSKSYLASMDAFFYHLPVVTSNLASTGGSRRTLLRDELVRGGFHPKQAQEQTRDRHGPRIFACVPQRACD